MTLDEALDYSTWPIILVDVSEPFDKWVEIDSDAYIKRNSIVVKATGQVVRFGDRPRRNMAASDSQDMDTHGEQADIYKLPTADECPRHPSGKGYAL